MRESQNNHFEVYWPVTEIRACRRKAQAEGKKPKKELPEEVTRKIGEANMLYITGK